MQIEIRVVPNSKISRLERVSDVSCKVWLDVKPIDNKANIALVELLSEHFNTAKSNIVILRGIKSKIKLVEIPNGPKS